MVQTLYLKDCRNTFNPFCIDFSDYIKRSRDKRQTLLKSIKPTESDIILDTTAGLGRDSFILAKYCKKVIMIEQNSVIFSLLKNAIDRAKEDDIFFPIAIKMFLYNQNSYDFLSKIDKSVKFDYIYIDPMFNESKKSRLVKKNMQLFHKLTENIDIEKLFLLSLQYKVKAVVVKRSLTDIFINNQKPTYQVFSKTIRFDVYK